MAGLAASTARDDFLRGAVRQPAQDRVEPGPVDLFPFHQLRQVQHEEMRKHLCHRLAGMGVGGERGDFGIGMPRQQAHRVGAGVAGRTQNADLLLRAHHIAPSDVVLAFNCVAWLSNNCGRNPRISQARTFAAASFCPDSAVAMAT